LAGWLAGWVAPAGLPELHPGPPDFDYPRAIRWWIAACIPANVLLLATTLYYSLRWAAVLLALCGPLGGPIKALLAAWVVASFAQSWQPVNAVAEEERRHRRRQQAGGATAAARAPAPAAAAHASKQD
jgi:hypothetical protein